MLQLRDTDLYPEAEPVRRFGPFPEPPLRRTFTREVKARLVAESFNSDESVCAFARRHGLTPSQMFAWRKAVRRESGTDTDGSNPSVATTISEKRERHAPIEITIGSAVVRVQHGVDPATLKAVLQALRDAG